MTAQMPLLREAHFQALEALRLYFEHGIWEVSGVLISFPGAFLRALFPERRVLLVSLETWS